MMNNTIRKALTTPAFFFLWLISAILAGIAFVYITTPTPSQGSVNSGQEYQSTTTDSTFTSLSTTTKVCVGNCALGSVVVTATSSATGPAFTVWDSAAASTSVANTATSTLLGKFPGGTAAGTYTFDLKTSRGIILDIPTGFTGVYAVTYRKYGN